jgi:hypothetical protein
MRRAESYGLPLGLGIRFNIGNNKIAHPLPSALQEGKSCLFSLLVYLFSSLLSIALLSL